MNKEKMDLKTGCSHPLEEEKIKGVENMTMDELAELLLDIQLDNVSETIRGLNQKLETKKCVWRKDRDLQFSKVWDTGCGQFHYFGEGSPKDNEYTYCPYCGGRLIVEDEEQE